MYKIESKSSHVILYFLQNFADDSADDGLIICNRTNQTNG